MKKLFYSIALIIYSLQGYSQNKTTLPAHVPKEIIISYEMIGPKKNYSSIKNKLNEEYSGLSNVLTENLNVKIVDKKPVHKWLVNQMTLNNLSEAKVLNPNFKNPKRTDQKGTHFSQQVILKIGKDEDPVDILRKIKDQEIFGSYRITSASLNGFNYFNIEPNDALYSEQWSHIKCKTDSAWSSQTGSSSVRIGIIDSGIDSDHEDLIDNVVPGYDFVDIDTSLYKVFGYELISVEDYTSPDNNPIDFNGHGTHCSGIIGATGNNITGIAGVCHQCSLMPLRSGFSIKYDGVEYGMLEDDDIASAIVYAVNHNVDILNMSFGGRYSEIVKDAIDYAFSQGILIVAAAGNSNSFIQQFPAGYSNVISVAASNESDQKAYFSNYGDWVDIIAPGTNIISTIPKTGGNLHNASGYRVLSGTSMATPYVSGLAGLILSEYPSYSNEQIWAALISTTDNIDSLNGQYKNKLGTGRVNSKQAIYQVSQPNIIINEMMAYDSVGDLNGVVNPGETISLKITLNNIWQNAENVSIKIKSNDTLVTLIDSIAEIGNISTFATNSNKNNLFHFLVDPTTPDNHDILFNLQISATGYSKIIPFTLTVSIMDIIKIPADFATIQQGINAANNGDLIMVEPGQYYENINFKGKNISVVSEFYNTHDESFIENTVIDGSSAIDTIYNDSINGSVVFIANGEDQTAKLIGFTLRGGSGSYVALPGMLGPNYLGGAVLCYNSSPELKHLRVIDNHLGSSNGSGAGICITQCSNESPLLDNIIFENNKGSAAINVSSYSKAKIQNINILNNRDGDGIYFHTSSGEVLNSKIENCTGEVVTGLMGIQAETLIVSNTEIKHNTKGTDFRSCDFVDIQSTLISNNYKDGGMWLNNTNVNITNCTLADNTISNHFGGGAIFINSFSKVNIVNSIIYDNKWNKVFTTDTSINSISFLNDEGSILSTYSDIEDGTDGIMFFSGADNINVDWLDGNMDTVPIFHHPSQTDYHLKGSSPLKAKGIEHFVFNGDTLVELDSIEYFGEHPDMGAYLKPQAFVKSVFDVDHSIGSSPLTVNFSNSSYAYLTTPPDAFLWVFGDGDTSYAFNPTHTYKEPGVFSVELCAFNNLYEDKITKTGFIEVYQSSIIYVDTAGSDITGDGSRENPYRTVQHSIDIAEANDIIIINRGKYVENLVLNGKDIILTSQFYFSHDTKDIYSTIIDGNHNGSVITFDNYVTSESQIIGLTIQNGARLGDIKDYDGGGIYMNNSDPKIKYCIIKNNVARYYGGGIFIRRSDPIIENCIVDSNTVVHSYNYSNGGGIYIGDYANPRITKSVISNNSAMDDGGGIFTGSYTNPIIEQATFYNNKSLNKNSGGFYRGFSSISIIKNSIFWNNHPKQISESISGVKLDVTYSDIQDGYTGSSNIDKYPQFVDTIHIKLQLHETSPCIDKGDPVSELDPDLTRADMGAFYYAHQPLTIFNALSIINTCEHDNISLTVIADGQFPLKYVWHKNSNILTDTTANLNIQDAGINDNGSYYCIVNDIFGNTDTTNTAIVSIHAPKDTSINVLICHGSGYFAEGKYQTGTGTYYDTLAGYYGCDSVIVTNLTVLPSVKTTIDTTICHGSSYFAEGKYQTKTGIFQDTLQSQMGCDSIIISNVIVDDCTGINSLNYSKNRYIYPNPSNGIINIEIEKFIEVIIFDIYGKIYGQFDQNQIDISHLPNGLYFILLKIDKKNNRMEKLILLK